MLRCKKLHANAILPSVAHPGEDLGYDLYAVEDAELLPNKVTIVSTGIAAQFTHTDLLNYGLLFRDRSGMAAKGITVSGGVIDASYTGELKVLLTNHTNTTYKINAGEKIVQMLPELVRTQGEIAWVDTLPRDNRGDKGFGSSGK